MPRDFLGPTLEEVQMWLRSASGWVPAGFVLNVEPVNARLGRVLVVEDDPGIATQLVRGLTRAGYETGSVTTGKAALDWPVPDVFLLDLGLPDMDGGVVCRQEMLERAWDEHWYGPTKVLDVHMAALRKKLGDPGLIETVYGHGFRLADQGGTP